MTDDKNNSDAMMEALSRALAGKSPEQVRCEIEETNFTAQVAGEAQPLARQLFRHVGTLQPFAEMMPEEEELQRFTLDSLADYYLEEERFAGMLAAPQEREAFCSALFNHMAKNGLRMTDNDTLSGRIIRRRVIVDGAPVPSPG